MIAGRAGFTLIEVMVVLVLLGILAMTAIPSFQIRMVRNQILEALPLAELVKTPVAAAWPAAHAFPADNAAAGLPAADKIVNNYISSVAVESGAVQITFGNHANALIRGKVLTLRPAVVEDAPVVPVAWVCAFGAPPGNMTPHGANRTTVDPKFLSGACQAG